MSRILSQSGNVIAADFAPPTHIVRITGAILYLDDLVCLMRINFIYQGRIYDTQHITIPV